MNPECSYESGNKKLPQKLFICIIVSLMDCRDNLVICPSSTPLFLRRNRLGKSPVGHAQRTADDRTIHLNILTWWTDAMYSKPLSFLYNISQNIPRFSDLLD
ncbi:hypothetical protein AVEN_59681-1 [Araneus ventricosus]|uniref:Uncharacterized protein n=1 Tax=Araneus ventricosus TaxID=182803 RepID=A0A4Y2BMM9_ARAVE|nr:hypothetical protein AVEN_59681-1 [Araneus ventricosus]